jgi:hypothetical protein
VHLKLIRTDGVLRQEYICLEQLWGTVRLPEVLSKHFSIRINEPTIFRPAPLTLEAYIIGR